MHGIVLSVDNANQAEISIEFRIAFLEEAALMIGLEHTNVLSLIAVSMQNEIPYVILPLMELGDLKTLISNHVSRI